VKGVCEITYGRPSQFVANLFKVWAIHNDF